jgi:hypothetical protein
MKTPFVLLIYLFLVSYQINDGLLGKWEMREHTGKDGAKKFTTSVANGTILLFKENNEVERNGLKGYYSTSKSKNESGSYDRLILDFGTEKYCYLYRIQENKLICTPVTKDFEIICDEGCDDIYYKDIY